MRVSLTRAEQVATAENMRGCPEWWTSRRHAMQQNVTIKLAESILERFDVPYFRQPDATDSDIGAAANRAYWKKEGGKAAAQLQREIAAARAERDSTKGFKDGALEW